MILGYCTACGPDDPYPCYRGSSLTFSFSGNVVIWGKYGLDSVFLNSIVLNGALLQMPKEVVILAEWNLM